MDAAHGDQPAVMEDEYLEEEEAPRRPPWFLLTGLILGLGIGLFFSLVISPVRYTDTAPASLALEYKDEYRWMIARAYQANNDLLRASQRLVLLGDANPSETLAAQAQRLLSEGGDVSKARVLALLASAISSAVEPQAKPTSVAPVVTTGPNAQQPFATLDLAQAMLTATTEVTRTPLATFTPRANPTQLPTLGAPFQLANQSDVCDPSLAPGLMQIMLKDASGQPVAGIQIHIAWDGGLDSFYTGLKPSISPGYADFAMAAGVIYSLRVGNSGETLNNLTAPQCSASDGSSYTGGLRLEFSQGQ